MVRAVKGVLATVISAYVEEGFAENAISYPTIRAVITFVRKVLDQSIEDT